MKHFVTYDIDNNNNQVGNNILAIILLISYNISTIKISTHVNIETKNKGSREHVLSEV